MCDDEIVSDLHGENPGIVTRHNGHTMPPRCAPGAPELPRIRFSTPRPPGTLALGWRADRSGVMPAPAPFARRLPASSLRPPVPGQPWSHAPDSLLWMDSVLQWRDADPPRLPARPASARREASPPSAP